MKSTLLLLALFATTAYGQYAKSEKLGKEDGFAGFKLDIVYSNDTKGLTKLAGTSEAWTDIAEDDYMVRAVYLADPSVFNVEKHYGAKVARIELLVNDLDVYDKDFNPIENSFQLVSIRVFLEIPKTETERLSFYSDFKKDYGLSQDNRNEFENKEAEFILWFSTTECGAMMRLTNAASIEKDAGNKEKHIELMFTGSCGG